MTASTETSVTVTILAVLAAVVIGVGLYVWYAAALSRVFAKTEVEPWRGWVPVLNEAEILRLGGLAPWLVVLYFIPVVDLYGLYLKIVASHRLNRRFGRGAGMTVLSILLPPVWASILAWGGAPVSRPDRRMVDAPTGAPATGPLADLPGPGTTQAPVLSPVLSRSQQPSTWPLLPTDREPVDPETVEPPSAQAPIAAPTVLPAPGARLDDTAERPVAPSRAPWAPPAGVPMPVPAGPIGSTAVPAAQGWVDRDAPDTGTVAVVRRPEPDDDDDATVVVDRHRPRWRLRTDQGETIDLTAPTVVLGRRPDGAEATVQYVALADVTRTISKQHARLDLVGDRWRITDLDSTNGVVLVDAEGVERPLERGRTAAATERMLLGRVGVSIVGIDAR